MSFVSQVLGGNEPIGVDKFFADSGTSITEESGAFWLRSGLAATAASYPRAAALEHCKISGIAATNATSMTVRQVADNGAGVIVAAFVGATGSQVLVSTDDGLTYAVVNSGLSAVPTGVIYNGTRFIVVGNDGSNIYTRYSTDGTSWSAGGTQAQSGGTSGTAKIAWNGSLAYGLVDNSTGAGTAFTTTDGVTLTARVSPAGSSWKSLIAGGSTFLVGSNSTAAYTTTTGASYTTVTLPAAGDMAAYLGGTWMVKADGTNTYYTSTDLITFTLRQIPGLATGFYNSRALSFDSNRVYAGVYNSPTNSGAPCIMWSDDLISWKIRGVTASLGSTTTWLCHAGKYFFPKGENGSTSILRTASFSTADYVGAALMTTSSATNANAASAVIYRKLAD